MRTHKEIQDLIDRFEKWPHEDFIGFKREALQTALAMKEGDEDALIKEAKEYLVFAIGKAVNHRGLSAGRSVDKLTCWCWVLEHTNFPDNHGQPYTNYGVPILKWAAEKIGADWPTDDPVLNAMAEGKKCPECESGRMRGCGE